MSTRSIVAVPHGDSWRGRYIHSDGYPTARAAQLWALVQRDGLETCRRVLTEEHYGWSSLDPDEPSIEGVQVPATSEEAWKFEYGSPEYVAYQFGPNGMYGDGRFAVVPLWGQAFTDTVIKEMSGDNGPYQQVTEDKWLDPSCTDDTEWAYVLADDGLWVLKCNWDDPPTLVGTYRWELAEPNWKIVEGVEEEDED